jgi:prepilin-type processing-associated H-X9-DG protein
VVIGIIALLISILLPSLNKARETANRVKCAANLRSIGQTMLLYENDNHGLYPRVYWSGAVQVSTGSAAFNNLGTPWGNTTQNVPMSLFLLLTNEDVTSGIFVCPSSNASADNYGGGTFVALDRTSFTSVQGYLSYSYACPFASSVVVAAGFKMNSSIDPTFAVAADINPGSTPATDNVTVYPGGANAQSNSNNHNKAGQNVLYADGHVEFQQTVACGYQNDNIYTYLAQGATVYNIPGSAPSVGSSQGPGAPNDSVLLPTDDDN